VLLNKIFLELTIPDNLLQGKKEEKPSKNGDQNLTENSVHQNFSKFSEVLKPINNNHQNFYPYFPPMMPINPQMIPFQMNPQLYEIHQKAQFEYIQRTNFINLINPMYLNQVYQMQSMNHHRQMHNSRHSQNVSLPINKKKFELLQNFLKIYEGQCNFFIFMNACKPYVFRNDTDSFV
jgi:hypothetical protein